MFLPLKRRFIFSPNRRSTKECFRRKLMVSRAYKERNVSMCSHCTYLKERVYNVNEDS